MVRRLLIVLGLAFAVAFLPSTAWASGSSTPVAVPAATATATTAPLGVEGDPLIVEFPVQWLAAFLLVGVLLVGVGAAQLVSSWGR